MYWWNPIWNVIKSDYEWAWWLVNSLIDYEEKLVEKIWFWQNSIKNSDKSKQTQEEKNIANWFRFNNKSYKSDKLVMSEKHKKLLIEFSEDPNYIFKNIVEVISRELIYKYLRTIKSLENSRVKVVNTSDFDDVVWWVDIIVEIENEKWEISLIWLDIAVSNNDKYLVNKTNRTQTKCIEYNLSCKRDINTKFLREVLQINPEIMWKLLYLYLVKVEKWESVDILMLYRNICEERTTADSIEYTWLNEIIYQVKSACNYTLSHWNDQHILQIN